MNSQTHRSKRVSPGLLRTRFHTSLLICFVWVCAIILKLVYVQVFQHEHYVERARKQRESIVTLDPERGPIMDRKGRQLAISIAVDSIYLIPEEMHDPLDELKSIAAFVSIDPEQIASRLKNRTFYWLARKVSRETAEEIRKLRLPGVYFTQESRRFYPNRELATHVVGFVGLDNKGLSGVEHQYDPVISGVPGKITALRDAKKRLLLPSQENAVLAPTVGRSLQLTIDAAIQHIAEQELKEVVEQLDAKGGSVVIMNPYTGEIIALANEPTFNPNTYREYSPTAWKNKAIQDYYEPGSTFKTVVAAAALDRELVTPEDLFDCQYGAIVLAGHTIHDHKPFGTLTFRQVLEKSSDVGMIKVGLMLGPEQLVDYTRMLGFGKKTGIDLSGEGTGLVRDHDRWSAISIGAFSMGQEVGVTAIQLLNMMSAIGNGGFLPVPHTVSQISESSGRMKPTVFPEPQQVPIKHSAILTLQDLLRGVVTEGTGTLAAIPGYSVSGKTGTAQKIGPSRTYADGGYIASFVGYAPAENPAISMICILDEPKRLYHGGESAAPLFRKIGQQVLKYLDIPPDQITETPALKAESAFPRAIQATEFPDGIEPASFTPPESHHKLEIATDDGKASELVMPPLYGRTVSEIIQILSKAQVQFRLRGTGTVIKQWPAAGEPIKKDDLCIITLATTGADSSTTTDLDASRK